MCWGPKKAWTLWGPWGWVGQGQKWPPGSEAGRARGGEEPGSQVSWLQEGTLLLGAVLGQ